MGEWNCPGATRILAGVTVCRGGGAESPRGGPEEGGHGRSGRKKVNIFGCCRSCCLARASCFPPLVSAVLTAAVVHHAVATMGLKNILSSVLLAAPLALAHPGKEEVWQHAAVPMERRSLDHCSKEFNDPEFIRRTVESHGREYMRLRREVGIEPEATCVSTPTQRRQPRADHGNAAASCAPGTTSRFRGSTTSPARPSRRAWMCPPCSRMPALAC